MNGVSPNIHLGAGIYHLSNSVLPAANSCIYGDGIGNTTLLIGPDFLSSAAGVIVEPSSGGATQGFTCIHDLTINFTQPTTLTSRGQFAALGTCNGTSTGCEYPPAVLLQAGASSGPRFIIYNIQVAGAWDGIAVPGSGTNVAGYFGQISMGAIDKGLYLDGSKDSVQIFSWHSWNFGFGGTTFSDVYLDGNTIAAQFNKVNGLDAHGFFTLAGNINVNDGGFFGHCIGCDLDTNAELNVQNSNWLQWVGGYATQGQTQTACQITQSGGKLMILNVFSATGTAPAYCISGGQFSETGSKIIQNGNVSNQAAVTISGTGVQAKFTDLRIANGPMTDGATALIADTTDSTSTIQINGLAQGLSSGGNPIFSIVHDNAGNDVEIPNLDGWNTGLAFGTLLGVYNFGFGTFVINNAGGSGTVVNGAAMLSGGSAVKTTNATTDGGVGIIVAGAGTTGQAVLATSGQATCIFDGATTAGHWVGYSSTTGGDCTDAGASRPTHGLGRVLSTLGSAGAGTIAVGVF